MVNRWTRANPFAVSLSATAPKLHRLRRKRSEADARTEWFPASAAISRCVISWKQAIMQLESAPAVPVYEAQVRVRYAETDQMGVVYHSNYIIWFEVGRVEMLRELGFTYREMEKQDGINLAVVEARCRFKAPAMYDDLVLIRTRLVNVRDSLLHFSYEVLRDQDGTLLAEGETIHLVVDND